MAETTDPRTVVGSYIQARATQVKNEARALYGANYKDKMLIGRVLSVQVDYPKGRKRTRVEAEFIISAQKKKRKTKKMKKKRTILRKRRPKKTRKKKITRK